jgi:hypothetical protein
MDKRKRLEQRKSALWTERTEWETHWRDLSRFVLPRAGRFQTTDVNKGQKKDQDIIDSTARQALRTLAAGMMSGVTSPARPWFRLALADKDLMEHGPVKEWLHTVGEKMRAIFNASNTYNALHSCYEELGTFGTWACPVVPDFENVIHLHPLTVGEYALATDDRGRVDTAYREFRMTVAQLVKQFGLENCSTQVRNLHDRGNFDAWVTVIHVIQPRDGYDPNKRDGKQMPFASCYFEEGTNEDKYLGERGFKRFPVLAPRWVVTGNDVYGRSPGMDALGDVKQLQFNNLRMAQAIELQVNPPLQVPNALKDKALGRLPGGVSYYDATGPGAGIRTAYDVNLRLDYLQASIVDVRERINRAFYADLWLLMANDQRSNVTATEVVQKREESLIQLGPVLERLHNELLSPLIDITFDRCVEVGILPPAPPELQGMDMEVEFISTMAQAQRMVGTSGMERVLTTAMNLAAAKPEILDKLDFDQVIDDMADIFGVNPKIVVPDDEVAALREQRAAQQQAMQAAAAAPVAVDAAKTAGDIDVNNLQDVMQGLTGYTTSAQGI